MNGAGFESRPSNPLKRMGTSRAAWKVPAHAGNVFLVAPWAKEANGSFPVVRETRLRYSFSTTG